MKIKSVTKLYQITRSFNGYKNFYKAVSLVTNWEGHESINSDDAEREGELHQAALEYLYKIKR